MGVRLLLYIGLGVGKGKHHHHGNRRSRILDSDISVRTYEAYVVELDAQVHELPSVRWVRGCD